LIKDIFIHPVTLTYWETTVTKIQDKPLFISGAVTITDMRIITASHGFMAIFIQSARHQKNLSVYGGHHSSR
jgi:hypothetical protein